MTLVKIQGEEVDMVPFYTWGCISTTGWTGLIKHIAQEVAGCCSLKPSLPSALAGTLVFVVKAKGGSSTVKDAGVISTNLQEKKGKVSAF